MDKEDPGKPPMGSRRKFIIRGCLLFLAAGFLYLGWWWRKYQKPQDCGDVIVALLKHRLGYLEHDPSGLARFASEYQDYLDPYVKKRLVKCALFLPVYGMFDEWLMGSGQRDGYVGLAQPVVTHYLLSTGFFNRATGEPDYSRPLNYQTGGIRATLVCTNPWADLSLPPASSA